MHPAHEILIKAKVESQIKTINKSVEGNSPQNCPSSVFPGQSFDPSQRSSYEMHFVLPGHSHSYCSHGGGGNVGPGVA